MPDKDAIPPVIGQRLPDDGSDLPLFWPLRGAADAAETRAAAMSRTLRLLNTVVRTQLVRPPPEWASPNAVRLDLHTLRLREFSLSGAGRFALVVAPYAGHASTIADFSPEQSLVRTLQAQGLERVAVTDWKSADDVIKGYDIDNYLAELNACVDDLGGQVDLIGLCQGGWLSAMFAARFPEKVATLVLAGTPIDTHAGRSIVTTYAERLPDTFFQGLVAAGGGVLRGEHMLAGFKSMHPDVQYFGKFRDLYAHIDDKERLRRFEAFERWYEHTLDLPGVWYLQVVTQIFKQNRLAEGRFVGLGRRLLLSDIACPVYLLAGETDDVTPKEQLFAAETLLDPAAAPVVQDTAPGGHIGLFMGADTLDVAWPKIAQWILRGGFPSDRAGGACHARC